MDDNPMRLGSMKSPHGALYMIQTREDEIKMYTEVWEAYFERNGVVLTPQIRSRISDLCRKRQDKIDSQIDAKGIPPKLRQLFEIAQKSKVIYYCKKLCIAEMEMNLLIHNCSQIEFIHHSKFPMFVPKHLEMQDSDFDNLKNGKPTKFFKKYNARLVLGEEKRVHAHLFEKGSQWHCFYGTYQDMQSDDNHWEHGSHIHYLSYLWSNYSKKHVWEAFDERNTEIAGSVHIRFEKIQYPPPNIPW